jgi:hypothetical protein
MTRRILVFVVGIVASAGAVIAHHSIAGAYDTSRQVTIEGIVSQFQFVNPHPFLIIDVKESNAALTWRLEMDNRSELSNVGMTAQTFKSGDRVLVIGSPSRSQQQSLYIRKLDRPVDGFQYEQVGGSPRVRHSR